MIEVKNLSYAAGRNIILNDISLSVCEGQFACIAGPNGAGKSTLVKLICGLMRIQKGGVAVAGRPVGTYGRKELATLVGYVPQSFSSTGSFTVEEYIMTGRYPYQTVFGGITPKDTAVVERVIETTGLEKLRGRDMDTLSGGERQRVMIATALVQETDILALDEPTIFLDPRSSLEILLLLQSIHRQGITIIMVTHDINQALLFGSSFIGLRNGAVHFQDGDIKRLIDGGCFNSLFDMSFYEVIHPEDGTIQLLPGTGSVVMHG